MKTSLLIGCLLVLAALRLSLAVVLPLSGDEAYHWEWSRHLDGAYYDHPGMTAWLIALSEAVLPGGRELAVRLPALLSLFVTTLLAFGFANDLARTRGAAPDVVRRAGALAAALVYCVPLPAGLSVYMSTDPPLMPCWLGAVWALFAAIQRGHWASWFWCGACLGLAVSTKLISLLLLGAFGAFLVLTQAGRAWLRRPQPWLALGVCVLATLPLLHWNATHDWMTFRFNFAIRQREQVASVWHPLVFVGGQVAVLTPGFCVLALLACRVRGALARPATVAVLCGTVLPLAFFLLVSLRRKIGVHWAAAPWLCALVLLAVAVAMREPWTQRRVARIAWRSSWALCVVTLLVVHVVALVPERVARLDLVREQPRRVLRNIFGWPEVGRAVALTVADLRATPESQGVFVMSNQYGTAASIAFYTPGQPAVHLWTAPRNHGRNYAFWDDWQALRGQDAVYVSKHPLADWELPQFREHFAAVSEIARLPIMRDDEVVNAFFMVRCVGFDGRPPFPPPE